MKTSKSVEKSEKRYVCIHGHFYQPPRENPWLERIEVQDSASPYHDWNERICAECYAPNTHARIQDRSGRVERMINIAEYKRRQAAPGVKVTLKNFGRDRRYPITNRFRDPGTPMPAPDVSLVTGKPAKSEAFDF